MPRYIDADALIHEYYKNPTYLNLCTAINNAPTANVVEMKCLDKITEVHEKIGYEKGYRDGYAQAKDEVVRCKECKHWNTAECHSTAVPDVRKCMAMNVFTDPDQFCKYGERREDEKSTKRTD